MGRGFQKSKGSLDGRAIKRTVEKTKERDEGLHEEGEKFLRDKEALTKRLWRNSIESLKNHPCRLKTKGKH